MKYSKLNYLWFLLIVLLIASCAGNSSNVKQNNLGNQNVTNSKIDIGEYSSLIDFIQQEPVIMTFAYGQADSPKLLQDQIDAGNLNQLDKNGNTALIIASRYGRKDNVYILLNAKANVTIKNNYGYTALMLAVKYNHSDIVEMLKKAGATE